MIAVVFALPEESQDLTRALSNAARVGAPELAAVSGTLGQTPVLVVHTGMGQARALRGMQRLWDEFRVQHVVSAGFAGGLDPQLQSGALLLGENHSNPELLSIAQSVFEERAVTGMLATGDAVLETVAAKAEFARQSGAAAVDMETAAVSGFCREHGIAILSIRVISDTAHDELPVPLSVWFDVAKQRPRPLALVAFLLRRPLRIPGFVRFVLSVNRARRVLTAGLIELLPRTSDHVQPA